MSKVSRILLLVSAALCGGFVGALGIGFDRAVEPDEYTWVHSVFWVVVGIVFSGPLWVPATIPAYLPRTLTAARRIGAVVLLLPIWVFASIVFHNINREYSGLGASPSAILQGLLLGGLCVLSWIVLMWPDVPRARARLTSRCSRPASPAAERPGR